MGRRRREMRIRQWPPSSQEGVIRRFVGPFRDMLFQNALESTPETLPGMLNSKRFSSFSRSPSFTLDRDTWELHSSFHLFSLAPQLHWLMIACLSLHLLTYLLRYAMTVMNLRTTSNIALAFHGQLTIFRTVCGVSGDSLAGGASVKWNEFIILQSDIITKSWYSVKLADQGEKRRFEKWWRQNEIFARCI